MFKRSFIFISGVLYDILMTPFLILFIPFSFLFKTLNNYRSSRESFFKLYNQFQKNEIKTVVFYCSSVGEFEQAWPLIKKFEIDKKRIVIFFHSKNGLNYCNSISACEAYLTPFDLFFFWFFILKKIRPEFFIVNRHEFWPGAVLAASFHSKLFIINYIVKIKAGVVSILVFLLSQKILCVNEPVTGNDKLLFSGDTRIDRLKEKYSREEEQITQLRAKVRLSLATGERLVLIGNCYTNDLKILLEANEAIFKKYKFLVVPARKGFDLAFFKTTIGVTTNIDLNWKKNKIIILNTMGNLFELYGSADVAWIGGGFTNGIHNCLEADFFKIPMLAGPNLNEQPDALFFKQENSLHIFETGNELNRILTNEQLFSKTKKRGDTGYSPTNYIYKIIDESNYSS